MRYSLLVSSLFLLTAVACGGADDDPTDGLLGNAELALTESSCPVHSLISSLEFTAQRYTRAGGYTGGGGSNIGIADGAFYSTVFDRDDIDGHCEDPTAPLGGLLGLFPGQYQVRILAFDRPGGTEGGGVLINDQDANPQLDAVQVAGGSSVLLTANVLAASGDLVINGGISIDNESFDPPPGPAGCCCGGDLCAPFSRIDCLPTGGCFWDSGSTISDGVCAPCR